MSVGDQVARLRALRGMTQEQLAEASGLSVDTIKAVERGRRGGAVRLATLSKISVALDVHLSVTMRMPLMLRDSGGPTRLLDIRRAVTSDVLTGLADFADDGPLPDLPMLRTSVDTAWHIWQAGDYSVLSTTLPDLITEARHAVRECSGDEQVTAYGLLATTFQLAAGVTVMLGAEDLAWSAAERALAAANRCDDGVTRASASHFAAWVLRRQGRYDDALRVAVRAAEEHEPSMSRGTPEQLAVWGGLLINASGAAARMENGARAEELLTISSAAAARLGRDRADRWAVFGPRLVAQTRVENQIEVGELDAAIRSAHDVPDTTKLPPTWESRYLLGLAQAQAEAGHDDQALDSLLLARETTPEWVRYSRLARDTALQMLNRSIRRRRADELEGLVKQLQLAI